MSRPNARSHSYTRELGTQASQIGQELGAIAKTAGRAAEEQLRNVKDVVYERASSMQDMVVEHIEDRPIRSVLIAAGVGLFLGLFFFRR